MQGQGAAAQGERAGRQLRLHPADNVAVAIDAIEAGTRVGEGQVAKRIPAGHKLAIAPIAAGAAVRKYGQVIGVASAPIQIGDWVHEHNVVVVASNPDVVSAETGRDDARPLMSPLVFDGYHRADGRVGVRNYLAILTSVNCSATAARFIAEEVTRSGVLADYPNVDGVISLVHGTGCGLDVSGEFHELLKRTQWGYATNPNVGGVLFVGLGCEAFQIPQWKAAYGVEEGEAFRTLTIQDLGGTRRTVEAGAAAVREMLPSVNAIARRPAPASALTLGLQCGGSDGYSGITANPALGAAVDLLAAQGGAAILSETPEIYGAEHLLAARAISADVSDRLMARIRWWEAYTAKHAMEMNNNPSPGNKAGGLTTILEKSLGAVAKGGTTELRAVYAYAEKVTEKGLVFMDTPGYDPVSATGQVAGGANVLCFTTGRGSAFGCKPTPSIKLASNTRIFNQMRDDMDINCGDILDGVSVQEKGREILDMILAVASGQATKSEELGYGDQEFVPWQLGATM